MNHAPINMHVGFLEGASSGDAADYCRGFISKHFTSPKNSGFFLKSSDGGVYYEVQEGGDGKAYLPSILKYLEEEGSEVVVKLATRYLKVKVDENSFNCYLMPESYKLDSTDGIKTSSSLVPYTGDARGMLIFGGAVIISGLLALSTAHIITRAAEVVEPVKAQTDIFKDMLQKVNQTSQIASNQYVDKLFYQNGRWDLKIGVVEVEEPESASDDTEKTEGGIEESGSEKILDAGSTQGQDPNIILPKGQGAESKIEDENSIGSTFTGDDRYNSQRGSLNLNSDVDQPQDVESQKDIPIVDESEEEAYLESIGPKSVEDSDAQGQENNPSSVAENGNGEQLKSSKSSDSKLKNGYESDKSGDKNEGQS